jgi:outer membrane protein OmpA-like peptidoglycan-associated protein
MPTLAPAATTKRRRALTLTSLPFLGSLGVSLRIAALAVPMAGAILVAGDARAQTASGTAGTPAPSAAPAAGAPAAGAPAGPSPAPAPYMGMASPEEPGAALEREWRERDRQLGETATLTGGVGLLHMQHAQGGAPGQIRLGFTTEYFSSGFLCTTDFPCKDPRGTGSLTTDSLDHIGGSLTLSATLTKWLEAYAGTGAFANSDASNRPSLLQVLGDTDFGLKAYGKLGKWLHLGAAAELWLVNGTGAVGLDGSGTSAKFRLLATGDFRDLPRRIPLRFSLNGTYSLDNSGDVVTSTEASRGTSITRIERFGLQVNRVDHIDVAAGLELFAASDRVRPFVEYNIEIPTNRQNYLCRSTNVSGDKCLANSAVAPSKITGGFRVLPWKKGFSLTAAVDVGVSGVNTFIEEVAPQAPWTLYIGAGWSIDTRDRPPVERVKIVEKLVEMRPPPGGHVKGLVHEKDRPDPVANAIVSIDTKPELTSLATGPDGRFTTQELPEGSWSLSIRAEGYKDGTCTATLVKSGAAASSAPAPGAPAAAGSATTGAPADTRGVVDDVQVDCPLEALPRVGRVFGKVRDADSNAPVPNAQVRLTDAAGTVLNLSADAAGGFRFEAVQPGVSSLAADADGYMTQVQPVDVKPRLDNSSDVALRHRPKNPDVAVTAKEITIKRQVQFATDSATILGESTALLTEIADVFIRNPRIRKVEVQGHTDSEGPDDHNQTLSEERANAVRTWLVEHGVAGDRMTARGYGEKKPLVPNVTAQNRARNRRVQFIILEQDAANPKGASAAPAAPPPAAAGQAAKKSDPGF